MIRAAYKPKVSIVMCFCKEPLQWIRLSVESILDQTFRDFELILICDNPEYEEGIAYANAASQKDSRITLYVNDRNIGPTRSFNKAIALSEGMYIARMDADDICLPERFERQVAYLDSNPHISVCATDAHIIDRDGNIIRRNRYRRNRDQALLVISNVIAHPSVMMRRSLLGLRDPLYNESYIYSQDYELWQYLTLKGHRIHTLEEPLLLYRKSDSQISSAGRRKQKELFKEIHRRFITGWLLDRGIICQEDTSDLHKMLEKCSREYDRISGEDRRYLDHIIYVLYFSLGTYDWRYRFRYLADRNLTVFRIRFIFTFRLFFSRKTRLERTGFI